jgi:hypothetical protein
MKIIKISWLNVVEALAMESLVYGKIIRKS